MRISDWSSDVCSSDLLPSLRRRRFRLVAAEVDNGAAPAFGGARFADVAAVEDQPVVRADAEGLRGFLVELFFDREHRLAGGEAGAVADAEDMRVDRESLGAKRAIHHDIGGLAPDARQFDERVAVGGDFAAEVANEDFAERNDILRLRIEQPDRLDRQSTRLNSS